MKRKAPARKSLETYRAKRSAGGTPEPFGTGVERPRLFVVQKHAATRLHYDFRLEWGGTLWSWAVPKGPSPNVAIKRMAVHVEDHPVEYADFEGIIPKGNYGAGPVIVWDKGLWIPLEDPDQGMAEGKLHFELRGYKLRGEWILVKTGRGGAKDWILWKKKDAWARPEEFPYPEESIFSGLTLEELREGVTRADAIRSALARLKAPRQRVDPFEVDLMLAQTGTKPFSSKDWIFELKYDGYRTLACRNDGGDAVLRSRNRHDVTATYPDVARAVKGLPYRGLVLDGELVCLDDSGRPDFQRLQKRSMLERRVDIERATVELPASLFVFDLLAFEGFDLRPLPLVERKALLPQILPRTGLLRYADHIPEKGLEMYAKVEDMRLEGIMAKKADAPYRGGRTSDWLKLPVKPRGDFVVCGYSMPEGHRPGFGALHVGQYAGETLRYAGRVGTGFADRQLVDIRAQLDALRVDEPPCEGPHVPKSKGHVWARPELVAEVEYKTFTDEGLLRQASFVRLREDKAPEDCLLEGPPPEERPIPAPVSVAPIAPSPAADKVVRISNPEKIFWPKDGFTKGDLLDYYRAVSPWLLPYLKDRPLVLTRYPDGIDGKSFYQKNVPDFLPDWIRTVTVYSESSEKEIQYLVCDDEETLLYIANMASIPLHLWPSRVDSIQRPDWCILDLDPKGAPFADVLTLARAIHALCEDIGLENYVKTSGSTGLHVLVPLGAQCTYEQSRMLGQLISRAIENKHQGIATTARAFSARKGRVYLDFLQNRYGQLLVSPYSVRPIEGAPVSMPLEWKEVTRRLDPRQFTIKNALPRLAKKKRDPMAPVLTSKPNLVAALAALAERLD